MGINASVHSAVEPKEQLTPRNHRILEESKANDWVNTEGECTHNGWGSSVSVSSSDQGWIESSAEAQYNGWGEKANNAKSSSRKTSLPEASSCGWMDEPVKGEYNGWISEPAKIEFNGWMDKPVKDDYNGWGFITPLPNHREKQIEDTRTNCVSVETRTADDIQPSNHPNNANPRLVHVAPSAPPMPEELLQDGVGHPPGELSPVGLSFHPGIHDSSRTGETAEGNDSSFCIICWEAPVEGACVPCGHMAGCMHCLNEVKNRKGDCPVCRGRIDQVVRLYAV